MMIPDIEIYESEQLIKIFERKRISLPIFTFGSQLA